METCFNNTCIRNKHEALYRLSLMHQHIHLFTYHKGKENLLRLTDD